MSQLPASVKAKKLTEIVIPGSHDSGTYQLDKKLPVGHDEAEILQELGNNPVLGPLTKYIIHRWSITQHGNIQDQLHNGIRYFDFRVAKLEGKFRIVHGLHGEEVFNIFTAIQEFLEQNQEEIVILHFQHYFDVTFDDHMQILQNLLDKFGSKLIEKSVPNLVINELQKAGKQVLVLYTGPSGDFNFPWPQSFCRNPWANTMDVTKLFKFLTKNMARRPLNCLYVSQSILTPNTTTILTKPFSTLFKATKPCNNALPRWIDETGKHLHPNIIMTDFVTDTQLPNIIVSLNYVWNKEIIFIHASLIDF